MADIKKILENMTIEQKAAQLVQHNANILIDTDADITGPLTEAGLSKQDTYCLGSVLNFKNAQEAKKIQDEHLKNDPNKIPVLFMQDVIHGYRTIYPIPLALGCSFDKDLVKECTRMASKEAAADGVHVTFTPMVDYVRDARWGRVLESCGEEPLINAIMGAAQVEAFQGENLADGESLATCVKHFAAYGGAEAGRDYNTVELSEHVLREYYLPAYKACIDAGTTMLMPSFNTLNGVPSVANEFLMKKILKDEWNFDGVVISDYNAVGELMVHGVAKDEKESAYMAFSNGCHIEMCSSTYIHHLKELIDEGKVTMEQIDEAVLKVLDLKDKLGLFENPYHGIKDVPDEEKFLTDEYRALSRRAAENCAVLLKNDGVLPLSDKIRKIALIGPFADSKEIIGFWSCNGKNSDSVTIKEGIEAVLPKAKITVVPACTFLTGDEDKSNFKKAIKAAKSADAVVLCLGESQEYSGEGNCRTDINLPGVQQELALLVAKVNKNVVAVTFSGRPVSITKLDKEIPAILHMWFPGTEGGNAVANLLFGRANPSGKLTMTFPKTVGQCPIYYNYLRTGRPKTTDEVYQPYCSNYIDCGNLPLYSFGHGLSYSNFVYENLTLSSDKMTDDGSIEVSIDIHNDSNVAGKETVMLYMHDLVASSARPVQQLIAFEKVSFEANERKTVKFTVTEPMLRFYDLNCELISQKGEFELSTGYADHLILTKKFELI